LQLKNELENGNAIVWNRLGTITKNMSEIVFEPEQKEFAFYQSVHAEKVLRENVKHHLLVGEKERTASEISEVLREPNVSTIRKDVWWIWPVAIMVILLIYIGWYFSENGIKSSPTGNTQHVSAQESPSGFYFTP
jgi:hypothetical protein